MAKKHKRAKAKKSKRAAPARKMKGLKKTAKKTRKKTKANNPAAKPVATPAVPLATGPASVTPLFGGFFGNKTEDQ